MCNKITQMQCKTDIMYFHQQPGTTISFKWNFAANFHHRKRTAESMLKGLLVFKYVHFKCMCIQRT